MSSKIGGGGEIVVLTIDHFNSLVHGWRVGSFICSEKGHQTTIWFIALYRHDASGFCDESGVADLACEELGMMGSEDEDKRGAYADDVAERTRNEEEASVSLQQFEAAAGYGGLGLNVGKTEVMGCRIKKAVVFEEVESAMKERISVKVDGEEMWGWIVPAKWRAELGISE